MNTHSRLSNRRLSARFSDDRVRIPAFIIDLRCRTEECARPYRSASNERLFVTRSILLSFVRVDGRVVSHFFKLVNSLQASSFERAPSLPTLPLPAPPPTSRGPVLSMCNEAGWSIIVYNTGERREHARVFSQRAMYARGKVQIIIIPITKGPSVAQSRSQERRR